MKSVLIFILMLGAYTTQAQNITFKIEGQSDTTVHLVKYSGKNLFYADTAEMVDGMVTFDGSKQEPGILALYLPGENLLKFVHNLEPEIYIEAKLPNLMVTAKARQMPKKKKSMLLPVSKENEIFLQYLQYITSKRQESNTCQKQIGGHEEGSEMYEQIEKDISDINDLVRNYQKDIIEDTNDLLVSKIVKMATDVVIPDAPLNVDGSIVDSNFRFNYFREHYFDNIDLTDDRLMRTDLFHNKFTNYFSKNMMIQHWDTVIYYAFDFIDRLDQKSDMFQYCVQWITNHYEKSKIMGMNKVFVYMSNRYYCTMNDEGESPAHWMPEDKLKTLCEKAATHLDLVMGHVPPNLILKDTTDANWVDFYSLDNEYTILYFWDPDCGHCKKITPKLQTLYAEKWRDRNIEIFSVGKAVGDDFEKWKAFINKHELEFINVAVTRNMYDSAMINAGYFVPEFTTLKSLNYQTTYDIFSTPKVWVLDKDKKIIAYSLTVSQLEDLMDRLQDKAKLPKLFPAEKEDKEEDQMH
ncbi:MAG: thiol-disulfide isomerase/thioredoxin [Crocinitomicaceae bacterium]|jgi:thiol-disulfide isomerase/thioredoxin